MSHPDLFAMVAPCVSAVVTGQRRAVIAFLIAGFGPSNGCRLW
jgi:hypothetical protein